MRRLPVLLACLLCLLAGCNEKTAMERRYVNKEYLFSFIPPKGWTVTEERTPACLVSVEARQGGCGMYVCVSQRPEDFLSTTSDFANCELIKAYVADKLKGYDIRCRPSLIQGRRAYDALYLRNVADGNGGARLQLVRQSFLARNRLLYTITSYVFGNSGEALKAAYTPCDDAIIMATATFFLHAPPAGGK